MSFRKYIYETPSYKSNLFFQVLKQLIQWIGSLHFRDLQSYVLKKPVFKPAYLNFYYRISIPMFNNSFFRFPSIF